MIHTVRTPEAYIEIKRFESGNERMICLLSADRKHLYENFTRPVSFSMTDYSFQTQIDSISGSFSISVLPDIFEDDKSLIDLVEMQDIVKIYEFGKLEFIGIITEAGYNAVMGEGGRVNRKIVLSGYSVGGMLERLSFVLDRHIISTSPDSDGENKKLFEKLAQNFSVGQEISSSIRAIIDSFFDVMAKSRLGNSQTANHIIKTYIDTSQAGKGIYYKYSVAMSFYATGENSLWQTLKMLFPPPLYEMFLEFDSARGVYVLVLRECPFPVRKSGVWDFGAWNRLPLTYVNSQNLKSYDLSKTSEDVYTFFMGVLPGSAISKEQAMVIDQGKGSCAYLDETLLGKYGFSPMYIEQKFFNRDEATQKGVSASELMKEVGEKAAGWFCMNDRMYGGNIEVMTVSGEVPSVGGRCGFLAYEFYVERVGHYWSYGRAMTSKLLITRGLDYTGPQLKEISDLTKKLGADVRDNIIMRGINR